VFSKQRKNHEHPTWNCSRDHWDRNWSHNRFVFSCKTQRTKQAIQPMTAILLIISAIAGLKFISIDTCPIRVDWKEKAAIAEEEKKLWEYVMLGSFILACINIFL